MGVQTTQALAIGAGIGGLSRIWLAAWMGTLPGRNSVEMAGAVCVGVGVFEPETRDRRRWAARARYGSLHPSGARLLSLSRRIIPWQLSRCARSQTRGEHGQVVPITTLKSDNVRPSRCPRSARVPAMLDQSSRTARSGALPQQAAGQRHFSLDSVCPGTEPSRSLRLHLTLVLSGPSSGVVQTAPS